jgi:hypothetical protein
MTRAVVLLAVLGAAGPALAAGQSRARPPRVDPLTASIRGRVTTTAGAPIRGAEVRLSADGRYTRIAVTTGDGRYELRDLPAGEFRLSVSRTGFISMQYGQRRPFDPPRTIALGEGQAETANVVLTRGGAIYGRVYDEFGDPVAGTRVQALRSRVVQGQRRLQSVGAGDQSDDTGAFRLYGLPPGEYYVAASAGMADQVRRDPPIYYPGTPNVAEAQPITLGVGAEAPADFQLMPVSNARVSGIVIDSSGAPVPAMVNLTSEVVATGPAIDGSSAAAFGLHGDSGADGAFTLEGVPPGPYRLTAMAAFPGSGLRSLPGDPDGRKPIDPLAEIPETASMPVVVAGGDVSGITLVTGRGGTLSGRFVADDGVVAPLPAGLRVNVRSANAGGVSMTLGGGSAREFKLRGPSGPVRVEILGLPESWAVSAVIVDGKDVTDEAIDLHGRDTTARIVLTDRLTAVSGTVQARDGAGDHAVVVFAEDSSRWAYPSRFVRAARTDRQGRFQIRGLPPGTRYLAAAADYLEDGEEQDPQVLERLRPRAVTFTLAEGEQRSIQLDAVTR